MKFELPDNLFVHNRINQIGPLEFTLTETFRKDLLIACNDNQPPELPPPNHSALDEAMALASHYQHLSLSTATYAALEKYLTPLTERLASLAQRSPSGAIAAILLCPWHDYASHHAINTTLLACRLGEVLAFNASERKILLLAALTMNLGTMALHDEMALQSTPPTTLQRRLIHLHPLISSALAREGGLHDELLHHVLLTHHERLDNRGYPFHHGKDDIGPLAHLLHLLDITIAKLMPHGYRSAMPARSTLAEAFSGTLEKFDPLYIAQLVKTLGIYPPGSFVELESGETALVVEQTEQTNTPRVTTLADRYNPIDTAIPGHRIIKPVAIKMQERFLPVLAPLWSLQ